MSTAAVSLNLCSSVCAIGEWQSQEQDQAVKIKCQPNFRNKRAKHGSTSSKVNIRPSRTSQRRRVTTRSPSPAAHSSSIKKLNKKNKSDVLVFPPPFKCPNCGRGYQRMQTLKRHLRSECNQPKKFICKFCDRGFHHNFKLYEHYARVHGTHP